MDKPWKIILLLAAIFVTGATTGGLVAVRVCKDKFGKPAQPPPLEQWVPRRLGKLTERLKLTPEQVEAVKPIMRRDLEELGQVRENWFTESRRIIDRMERDIAAQLTPEQQQEFEKVKQESAERWRKMMEERERDKKNRAEHGPDGKRRHPDGAPADGKAPPPPPGGGGC